MCITCHVVYSRCKVNEKANGHTSRGLSALPLSPPSSNCSQQAGALHTHPGWEHFMIITIIFPQKIIHRGLCQNWIAQPLEHMVQILCGECGESGRMPVWSCSTDRQRLPALPLSFPLSISLSSSLCLSLLCLLFSLDFPLVPLITCMVSLGTCWVPVLWKFTNGAQSGVHSYKKKNTHCLPHLTNAFCTSRSRRFFILALQTDLLSFCKLIQWWWRFYWN